MTDILAPEVRTQITYGAMPGFPAPGPYPTSVQYAPGTAIQRTFFLAWANEQIHTATHPARLAPSNSQEHTESAESERAEPLSTLDAEVEEDNEAENRL